MKKNSQRRNNHKLNSKDKKDKKQQQLRWEEVKRFTHCIDAGEKELADDGEDLGLRQVRLGHEVADEVAAFCIQL